jgi:pimeloyl-ACP methyl ester carboxylesterase
MASDRLGPALGNETQPRNHKLRPPDRQISGNGISFLHRAGNGRPFVLLHGIGSRGASFLPLIEALDPQGSVIAWDAPGYGPSVPLSEEWPVPQDYAEALEALLAELDIRDAILIGHSLGTLIATSYARHYGARLAGLVLMSPALGFGAPRGGPMSIAARARLDEFESLGAKAYAAKRAAQLVHDPAGRPELVGELTATMETMRQPGYGQAVRMLASGRLLDDVRQIALPTLILCGEEDGITPPDMARRVEAANAEALGAGARLELLPKAGHMIYLEATDAVSTLLRDFAASIPGPRRDRR